MLEFLVCGGGRDEQAVSVACGKMRQAGVSPRMSVSSAPLGGCSAGQTTGRTSSEATDDSCSADRSLNDRNDIAKLSLEDAEKVCAAGGHAGEAVGVGQSCKDADILIQQFAERKAAARLRVGSAGAVFSARERGGLGSGHIRRSSRSERLKRSERLWAHFIQRPDSEGKRAYGRP